MMIFRLLMVLIVVCIFWSAQTQAARAGGAKLKQTACSDDAELNQFWQLIGDNLAEYPFMKTTQLEQLFARWRASELEEKREAEREKGPTEHFHLSGGAGSQRYAAAGFGSVEFGPVASTRRFKCKDKLVTFQFEDDHVRTLNIRDIGCFFWAFEPRKSQPIVKLGSSSKSFFEYLKSNLSQFIGMEPKRISQLMIGKGDSDDVNSQSGSQTNDFENFKEAYDFKNLVYLRFCYFHGRVAGYSITYVPSYPLRANAGGVKED